MNHIGKNISLLREKFNFTQDQVAEFLGINRVQLAYIENGKRDATVEMLNKLSDLFNVELSTLLEEDEQFRDVNIALAYRSEELTNEDLVQVASFQKIVKNYIKLIRLKNG